MLTSRRSILFVDDDQEFLRTMKRLLERFGYEFTGVNDGLQALELLSDTTFDVIISDLRMPNLDGLEFMAELKRKSVTSPVIFLTGYGEVESYLDLMNMGAFDYLNKPVGGQDLLRVVRRALTTQESDVPNAPCH